MDQFQDLGEEFVVEDVETVIKNAIGVVLSDASYISSKANDWSNSVISAALKGLESLNRPYKYCITVMIVQKNGAGLVSASSTYWDASKDGLCKVTWENSTMHCVVTVFGTSVNVDSPTELD
uniref:Dynein light chain Tctex-type 1 n=1 Tax=Pseudictyota dubia TaxID=2749911 RepID=A0A7R9W941_9STRA|mmetsp:Transcript_37836/g.69874  ORF Transcript_37836/g.69874 Transcript_37836/m.69874 type:complete len:122 (+) Transcript_37836:100-465(+)|eukprot:CAMPEP_0197438798 /NCGR_PEP_ID=MMETSP1175-20131217/5694_1 /TAXON_ID=1003142 /ORGANISM="Triceratium dubium, Strain CCMP147" /LENGTH=121 /DNA_ID=CAMNT_0042968597 /DNA_START=42 /DNA_END=407 /DNA_ORIENTATION=-